MLWPTAVFQKEVDHWEYIGHCKKGLTRRNVSMCKCVWAEARDHKSMEEDIADKSLLCKAGGHSEQGLADNCLTLQSLHPDT